MKNTLTPQTTLPTEPGLYLFVGTHNGRLLTWQPEHVRAAYNGDRKLTFIGSDFWYEPKSAVGTWWKIELDPEETADAELRAARALFDRTITREERGWMSKSSWEIHLGDRCFAIAAHEGWVVKMYGDYWECAKVDPNPTEK